jgi:hypothetical protein
MTEQVCLGRVDGLQRNDALSICVLQLSGSVAAYVDRLGKMDAFKTGITAALQGKPLETVLAVWRDDSKILQSGAPKLPTRGKHSHGLTVKQAVSVMFSFKS